MDTTFIEDLPTGPLDQYRRQATFDWKELKLIFEDPDALKLKLKIWNTLERDPVFQRPDIEPTTDEQKRRAALQLNEFRKYEYINYQIGYTWQKSRIKHLMIVNEALACCFPDVSVKQALGVLLFANTLLTLGTERHRHIIEQVWNRKILSCLALTEVAHGSNTKFMRTSATFDKNTQEFIVHTPDFKAAKCWVGNLGKTCTHAMLFAQLYIKDQCHGLHAFIVPIRDPHTLLPYPGIIVGDVGEKLGLNGIDNGFIMFQEYRIPRENLLNRTADVTPEGEYESSFTDPTRILGAALENLSAGRVGIMQECSNLLIHAVTIGVRYAALRKQFGPNGDIDDELPIIDYQLHQWRLFPYVAASTVLRVFVSSFTTQYLDTVERSSMGVKIENLSEMVAEIHAMVSAGKPLITWTCMDAIQECREACGGNGFLKAARFGDLRNATDPSVTYEGDNNVLGQQTSNWLLRQWNLATQENRAGCPFNTCSFFVKHEKVLSSKFKGSSLQDVVNIEFLFECYEWLITFLAKETDNQQNKWIKKTQCKFKARNNSQVYKASVLCKAYGEYVALKYFWDSIHSKSANAKLLDVLKKLGILYGLWCLDKHLVYFYEGQYASGDSFIVSVRDGILMLCEALKPEIIGVIDALAPPDFVLNSVLGKADGRLYENLQATLFHNPGAMARPSWWHEIKLIKAKL